MNKEEIREYCIAREGATESFPFNDTALVFKVYNKMFAVLDLSEDERGLTVKCDPELAVELREWHQEVTPAWHFNKQHWNAISLKGNIKSEQFREWIDHSYNLIVSSIPESKRKLKS